MIIIPAIDIIHGEPVRLYQGDYNQKEIVGESVLDIAKEFEASGAKFLHLVDLEGAKEGKRINHKTITQVAQVLSIPVEIGGGIRTMEDIEYYLRHGIYRVILGTSAIEDQDLLQAAIQKYGNHIAVGLDCRDGYVYGRGWLQASEIKDIEFARQLEKMGVQTIIVTDISKDGTLTGPNIELYQRLKAETNMNIVASGGMHQIGDVKALKEVDVAGVIIGKALYHHTIDLKEAISISEGGELC